MPVLDASVLVEYLAGGPGAPVARAQILAHRGDLWAPHLVDAEVGHVLRRLEAGRRLAPRAASAALADLADLPLTRAGHAGLLRRAWRLRDNLTFYDGLYVALAEQLGSELLTFDRRLAAAPGIRAEVTVLA